MQPSLYNSKPSIIYGFHGTDKEAGLKILNQEAQFLHSNNSYDWLGQGVYFWENNLERARQYAEQDSKRENSRIKEPFVLGAVIELGNCLDLLDQQYIDFIRLAYNRLKDIMKAECETMPTNGQFGPNDFDFRKRELDCAVIRYACTLAEEAGQPFDSVRAAFIEGDEVYEGAKFSTGNHIQIAVINPDCIKGIFLPREAGQQPVFAEEK
ncbi:hypothetical protein THMIRHAS_03810 [Thiosulfatimonas sediminis]|uniref:DUF3990 domain-containing protein n=1 Tax=Thiosulfatimonas sediminis TaxID=2675054 RepID=A0A6F8PSL2_9GAMM|nr:hypothetical protein [Thiosulfatimonas sediminis]BBP45008.1 hypothetical protein THMIRHAS_03810 [Thiosulfatimonas sediminis]